jgi:hypothetical protein
LTGLLHQGYILTEPGHRPRDAPNVRTGRRTGRGPGTRSAPLSTGPAATAARTARRPQISAAPSTGTPSTGTPENRHPLVAASGRSRLGRDSRSGRTASCAQRHSDAVSRRPADPRGSEAGDTTAAASRSRRRRPTSRCRRRIGSPHVADAGFGWPHTLCRRPHRRRRARRCLCRTGRRQRRSASRGTGPARSHDTKRPPRHTQTARPARVQVTPRRTRPHAADRTHRPRRAAPDPRRPTARTPTAQHRPRRAAPDPRPAPDRNRHPERTHPAPAARGTAAPHPRTAPPRRRTYP